MKRHFILLTACMTAFSLSAKIEMEPVKPTPGQFIQWMIHQESAWPDLLSLNLLIYYDTEAPAVSYSTILKNGVWNTTIKSEMNDKILFYKLAGTNVTGDTVDLSLGKLATLYLYNAAGNPVRDAFHQDALAWSGLGALRDPDLGQAVKCAMNELNVYPDNYQSRSLLYSLWLRQNENRTEAENKIHADLQKALEILGEDPESLEFAMQASRMIGDEKSASYYEMKLVHMNPYGEQAATESFTKIMEIVETEEQVRRLEQFVEKFPDTRMHEVALSQLVSAMIELDDSTRMIEIGEKLLTHGKAMSAASGLSALSGVLAEKKWELMKARHYIDRAIEILDNVDLDLRPREFSQEEWLERIQQTRARYQDIQGWIQFLTGDTMNALHTLEEASQHILDPGILFHLANVYEAQSEPNRAIELYARVIAFGGEMGELANESLIRLWKISGREESQLPLLLEKYRGEVQTAHAEKILKRKQSFKAPGLILSNINGGSVNLADFKGSPVLLCFWGTWSDASMDLLNALESYTATNENVVLLTVSVDKDPADISRFIRENRIRFPVLRMNSETARKWNVKGVPMLFVIDAGGIIRFTHKGHRPDIEEVLVIEVTDL